MVKSSEMLVQCKSVEIKVDVEVIRIKYLIILKLKSST